MCPLAFLRKDDFLKSKFSFKRFGQVIINEYIFALQDIAG